MKKFTTMAICFVLIACMVAGGSLAYLTDRDSEANVFTVGDVKIELNEDFEQGARLTPGVDIKKEPTITNTGVNDAWVWAQIAIPSALDSEDASKNVIHFNFSTESVKEGQWKWNEESDWKAVPKTEINDIEYNVYTVLYQTALKAGETTEYPVMTKVYMDTAVDIDTDGNWYKVVAGEVTDLEWNTNENGNPIIYVSAYGIQAEGFETVDDAYAAYGTQWGDNGSEYATVINAAPASGAVRPAGYNPVETDTPNIVDSVVVFDKSDDETNLRALYTGDGKKVVGDLTVTDSYLDGTYAMNVIGDDTGVLTVANTALRGWVSYDGFTSATFTDCTFGENSNPEIYNNIRPYSTVTFTNCVFDGTTFWLDMMPTDATITFENCTMNGEKITNASQLTIEYTGGTVVIK